MHWSLSEFLNLLHARSQCWGFVGLGERDGFRVRVSEEVMFYAMLEGSATISGVSGERIALHPGDTAIIIADSAHGVRVDPDAQLHQVDFLADDLYADAPHNVALSRNPVARMLCGRLKVRWPGGIDPHRLPPALKVKAADQIVNLDALLRKAKGSGSAALMTRAASLTLTQALREHPACQDIFRQANFHDPVARAVQLMELHLDQDWTVANLAAKVGMARSTFAGRFLAEVGKPPMEVLTDLRMRRAAGLVTKTQLALSEIGERVGYHSQSAFSRRFEKHFRMSPGKMRGLEHTDKGSTEHLLTPIPGSYIEMFYDQVRR